MIKDPAQKGSVSSLSKKCRHFSDRLSASNAPFGAFDALILLKAQLRAPTAQIRPIYGATEMITADTSSRGTRILAHCFKNTL